VVSRNRSAGVRACLLIAAACAVVLGSVVGCSTAPSPPPAPPAPPPTAAPPTGPPTLAGWKLTLPTANAKGDAATMDPAVVAPPYLTTDPAGALVFWAPVAGATTKHSDHARTELNSLTSFAAGTERHSLTASIAVNQVPPQGKDVIIAQIHGADDVSSVPYVMLHWEEGTLKVVVKQERSGTAAQTYPLTGNVPLGASFDVGITDNGDGTMTFTANYDGDNPSATAPVPAAFSGASVRFQAGAYQQDVSAGAAAPDDGARVTFSALTVS
jgi:hypothetical protein